MAKLRRITNKIFGNGAIAIGEDPQIGQFGSALAGTYVGTTDVETIQELPAWEQGWIGAVTPTDQFPALPEMTAVHKVLSYQSAYLHQEGISEYDANTTYYKGSIVKEYTADNGVKLYYSIIDNNQSNPLTDSESWQELSLGGGSGGLEIGDIGTALFVDETQGKRRKLNGSLLAIDSNTQPFLTWLKSVIATTPSLSTTEENWQSEVTLSALGQCGKFVIDEEVGTIRLPKVVNIQGLYGLGQAGVRIEAGLPNITGGFVSKSAPGVSGSTTGTSTGAFTDVKKTAGQYYNATVDNESVYNFSFDASLSNSIYGNSSTVQQEQIQYPYFIQIATGAETEVNIINEIELNNPCTLFDSKYSDHQLFNTSWLRSNGQYNSKAVYVKAYEALQVEQNSEIEVGETVTLPSGTSYTKQGLSVKLSTEDFTDYDYVLNTSDETFRLPKILKQNIVVDEGEQDGIRYRIWSDGYCEQSGKVMNTSSLVTVNFIKEFKNNDEAIVTFGDIYLNDTGGKDVTAVLASLTSTQMTISVDSGATSKGFYWKASGYLAESEISETYILYYYIGETTQNANLIDAGRITEQLAGLVEVKAVVIDTYINESSGYRIWSDGYCEQWGRIKYSDDAIHSVTYPKKFKDTNYCLTFGVITTSGYAAGINGLGADSISTTGFQAHAGSSYTTFGKCWKASGYLAEGEY